MPERLTGEHVVDEVLGLLGEWLDGEYCHPLGLLSPQFKCVQQGDGTWRFFPVDPDDPRVHDADHDGAVFRLTVTAERVK